MFVSELHTAYRDAYTREFVAPSASYRLDPRESLIPISHEGTFAALLDWNQWDAGFRKRALYGLNYDTCQFVENFFWFAVREDVNRPRISRSFAIVSRWQVTPEGADKYMLGEHCHTAIVYFPALDGINYNIGARRRETNAQYYSRQTERRMASLTATGDFQIGIHTPSAGETIYRCAYMPGKVFDETGVRIPSAASDIFIDELGFAPIQYFETGKNRDVRLFGQTVTNSGEGQRGLPFMPQLAYDLRPVWSEIAKPTEGVTPEGELEPDPDSF